MQFFVRVELREKQLLNKKEDEESAFLETVLSQAP